MTQSPSPTPRATAPATGSMGAIVMATAVTALGGFLFGYDTAVISGAIDFIQAHFGLDEWAKGWAVGVAIFGCMIGAMGAGFLSDRLGRKKVLLLCALLFAASGVATALPRTFLEFVIARLAGGLAIGASSMICPLYIAEIAPPRHRGRLGALFQLGIVVGIFLVFFVNMLIAQPAAPALQTLAQRCQMMAEGAKTLHGDALVQAQAELACTTGQYQALLAQTWNGTTGWRWMLGSEALPAVAFLLLLLGVPESPRWLALNNRLEDARRILTRFAGRQAADEELAALTRVAAQEEGRFGELFGAHFRRPLLIAVSLAAFAQFSGINAIMYYAPTVFKAGGSSSETAFKSTVVVGAINVILTLVAILFVDKAGRKVLLTIGTAVQTVSLLAVGWMFHAQVQGLGLLLCILGYVAAFSMAMGPIPWIFISEVFPARIRGRASSVGVLAVWVSCYIVAQTFPVLLTYLGPALTFWVFGLCSLASLIFVLAALPETKGRTLEEIEASWRQPRT